MPHVFAAAADVLSVLITPCEVGARENSVGPFALVEDRDEGEDLTL